MKPLCIYHGNCADGFGAAWAVRYALGDGKVDFHPGVYQDPPPDVTGRDVIMVDFSYKRSMLLDIRARARSILILDHHKSAAQDLLGGEGFVDLHTYSGKLGWDRHLANVYQDNCEGIPFAPIYTLFDMDRSGAGLAWDFFVGGSRPPLLDHIEDRDLWRFKLDSTREIQAVVFSHPYDFNVWDDLVARSQADADWGQMAAEGAAIERKHHKDVAELVKVCKRRLVIGGQAVWAASLPYTLTSDAGHLMAEGSEPFAACYWDTPEGRVFSLRSREGGADVSEIAKQYGGGGHKNAAGFRVPLARIGDFELAT